MAVRVTAEGWRQAITKRLHDDTERLRDVAHETMLWGETQAVRATNRAGVSDEGTFKLAWKSRREIDGASLRNDAPHASVVEYGRRPGAAPPPFDVIRAWVQRKIARRQSLEWWEIDEIAHAIRKAIGRRGIPPTHILGSLTPKLLARFRRQARRQLRAGGPRGD